MTASGCTSSQVATPTRQPATAGRCGGVKLTNGFELVVLGSGGPRAAGRAASSYLVSVGGKPRALVDLGPGAFARLGETGVPSEMIELVLLTHLHIDHAGDLPGFVKSQDLFGSRPVSFQIVGPSAGGLYPSTTQFVERLFGEQGAFAYLRSFRNELRFNVVDVEAKLDEPPRTILQRDGLTVSAIAVDHDDVPALGYRIEHAGHSVVFTGDLASRHARIEDLARGADVLVYDTAVLDPPGSPENLYALHTSPQRIGEVARAAGVKTLVLSHIPPIVEQHRSDVVASVRRSFAGEVRFAEDCLHIPIGGSR